MTRNEFEGFENFMNILDILKFLWNYLKLNYVLILCKLCALYVLPLGCDMWLLGDYLARYYSLCDIGILAPIFVTVISSSFVSTMSSSFVLPD